MDSRWSGVVHHAAIAKIATTQSHSTRLVADEEALKPSMAAKIELWISRGKWLISKVLKRGRRKRAGSLLANELAELGHRRASSWPNVADGGIMGWEVGSSAASSQSSTSPRGSPFTSPFTSPKLGASRRGSPYGSPYASPIPGGHRSRSDRRRGHLTVRPPARRGRARWACYLLAFFVFSVVSQLLVPVWFPSLVYVVKHRELWVDGVPPLWRPVTGLSLATLDQVNFEPTYNLPGDQQHHIGRGEGYRPGMHVALATAAQVNPTPEYTHCTESEFEGYTFSGPDGRPALKTLVALAADLKHHRRVHDLVLRFGDSGRFNFLIMHYEQASFEKYKGHYGNMWYPDRLVDTDGDGVGDKGIARWGGVGQPGHRAWSPRGDRGEAGGGRSVAVCVVVDIDHQREAMGGHVKLDLARKYLFPHAVRGKYEFIFLWDGDVILEDWRPKGSGGPGGGGGANGDGPASASADASPAPQATAVATAPKHWSFWNGDLAWFPWGAGGHGAPEGEGGKNAAKAIAHTKAVKETNDDGGNMEDDDGEDGGFDPVSYVDYVRLHGIHISQPAYSADSISAHSFNKHDGFVGPLDEITTGDGEGGHGDAGATDIAKEGTKGGAAPARTLGAASVAPAAAGGDRDRSMGWRPHWWVEIGFPVFHVEKAWVPIYDQVLRVYPFRYFCFDMIPWQCVLDGNITIGIVDGHHTHIVTHDASMKTIFERGISFFTALFQKRQTVLEGWWRQHIMDEYGCCEERYFDVSEEPTLAVCGARPPAGCAGPSGASRAKRPFAGWSGYLYPGPLDALERSPSKDNLGSV